MSLSDKKRWFVNIGVLLFSLSLFFLAAEIVARLFYYKKSLSRGDNVHKLFCEYDPFLGWKKIPHGSGTHITTEYEVYEEFNSQGIRGPEYSFDKKDNEYRIIILGDSFAEGYMVNFDELFSEVMKKKLNKNGNKYYEVINTGTGGYSTDQELLYFQNEGKKYNPDFTVLLFVNNDIWYNNQSNYWRGFKPLFRIEDNELKLTNVPVPKPIKAKADSTQSATDYLTTFQKVKVIAEESSYLYNYARDRIKNTYDFYALATTLGLTEGKKVKNDSGGYGHTVKRYNLAGECRVLKKTYDEEIRHAWKIPKRYWLS